jgi:hypothetical protein
MLLRFEIDSDYSVKYMKTQIDEITSILNILYQNKIKEEEDEDEEYIQQVGKSKIKKKKKDDNNEISEVKLLELIQEEINEQESKEEESKQETKEETKEQEVVVDDVNILCECGSKFVKRNRARHLKTKMHTEYLHLKNLSL